MSIPGMDETARKQAEETACREMEALSSRIKGLILSLPPRELLGYIWGQSMMGAMLAEDSGGTQPRSEMNTTQFVLEYAHAVWASFPSVAEATFDESLCAELFKTAEELRAATFRYCMFSALGIADGLFGEETGRLVQATQSNWVLMRGNRYGALEEEFYSFVLKPHDEALRRAYGIGSGEVAAGIQAAVNSLAGGHADAADRMEGLMEASAKTQVEQGLSTDQERDLWERENPENLSAVADVYRDLFQGGICNLSKHTSLPAALLEDLAFERGGHGDFFAEGPLSGTPLRTLPARLRPLIKLDGEFFLTDQAFMRDSAYRALLWNLVQKDPEYKKAFEARQKEMSETALSRVFERQLEGAIVHRELWYKNPSTGQWVENDLLIRVDDALLLVEAKSGAAATVASPATNFDRHSRAIADLIMKAYDQCSRFLEYLASAEEVPLYRREGDRYVAFDHVRLADFRLVLPIGLTVESFSPYSGLCKQFPGIAPILGRYPFVSVSIDDLFVLRRCLPTTGELLHYLEVRQAVAGIPEVLLFDETDHLGAYISKNRFDFTVREQLKGGADIIWWDGQSDALDARFAKGELDTRPPRQEYPGEARQLLDALEGTREKGWLAVASHLRDFAQDGRASFAEMLTQVRKSLSQNVSRYFQFGEDPPLFIWLQRTGYVPDMVRLKAKACAGAIAAGSSRTIAVLAYVSPSGKYARALSVPVDMPFTNSPEYAAIHADAARMKARYVTIPTGISRERDIANIRMPGPNDHCWCGSGKKYKKCHRA